MTKEILCAYLSHDLMFDIEGKPGLLTGILNEKAIITVGEKEHSFLISSDDFPKPYLRPLKELINVIPHNGQPVCPIVELFKVATNEPYIDGWDPICQHNAIGMMFSSGLQFLYHPPFKTFAQSDSSGFSPMGITAKANHVGYQGELFNMLHRFRFDIYDLINQGKATPINNKAYDEQG